MLKYVFLSSNEYLLDLNNKLTHWIEFSETVTKFHHLNTLFIWPGDSLIN